MRRSMLYAVATLLCLAACSNDNSPTAPGGITDSDPAMPLNSTVATPFAGSWRTTFGPPDPNTGIFVIEGVGVATQLGRNTFTSESSVDAMGIQTGTTVLRAANGDELVFEFEGPATPPDAEGNISFSGNLDFTGGTGRFADAAGTGTYHGTANVFAGVGEVSVVGALVIQPGSRGSGSMH